MPTRVKKIMEEDGYTIEDDEKDTIDQKKNTHKDPDEAFKWFEHLAGIRAKQPPEAVKLQQAIAGPSDTRRKACFALQKDQIIELAVVAVKRAFRVSCALPCSLTPCSPRPCTSYMMHAALVLAFL